MREFIKGDGTAVVFGFAGGHILAGSHGAEFAEGDEAAEIAVALGVCCEKDDGRTWRISNFEFRVS